jgi:hypothetical protein
MISASALMPRRAFFKTDPIPNWEARLPKPLLVGDEARAVALTQNEGKYVARGRFYEMVTVWPRGIPKCDACSRV